MTGAASEANGKPPLDPLDPKRLIRESYRMDGIDEAQCRSIFLDWALSLPSDQPVADAVRALLARHAPEAQGHPMTAVLEAALQGPITPRRRGDGARGRATERNIPPLVRAFSRGVVPAPGDFCAGDARRMHALFLRLGICRRQAM